MGGEFRRDLIPAGSTVLCALSGGADSMYLLSRLLECGCTVHAAHFNHQLRAAAAGEEQFVRNWCDKTGIPLTVGAGDVKAYAAKEGMGIEEAARELRYAFLRQTAAETGCTLIATGHHADDNAETVLMNLIRGCGLNGLCGIPPQRDNLIRPMLTISKADILQYLADHHIPHVEDESNTDPSYTRNRIRQQLIPLLNEISPQASAHIAHTARRVWEDEGELRLQAEALLTEPSLAEALCRAPRPVALRALKLLAPKAQSVHLEQMLELCRKGAGQLDIPGGRVCLSCGQLTVSMDDLQSPAPVPLRDGTQHWGQWSITCTPAVCPQKPYVNPGLFYLRREAYIIRSRREGDELRLGSRPLKRVKKLMVEQRIPRYLRDCVPLLADGLDRPAAAGCLGPHREFLAEPGSHCYQIIIRKEE